MTHWVETDYLGRPWVSGSSGPDAYDCYGLVRAVYRDRLNIDIPPLCVNALNSLSVARAMRDYDYSDWLEIAAPEHEFDVVEMSQAERPHHVGIYLFADRGGVLTSLEGIGVVYQSLRSLASHGWNIVQCYRRRPF